MLLFKQSNNNLEVFNVTKKTLTDCRKFQDPMLRFFYLSLCWNGACNKLANGACNFAENAESASRSLTNNSTRVPLNVTSEMPKPLLCYILARMCSDRHETLAKCVSDDSRHFMF